MNFLEAFDELDALNEASNQYQIPDSFKYRRVGGICPGCHQKIAGATAYEQHITGFFRKNDTGKSEWIEGCADALKLIADTDMPAKVKVGKAGHSYDNMTNISAAELLKYRATHRACEICGTKACADAELVYDHEHSNNGEHSGKFRGVLCNQCNLLLGQLERAIDKQNSLPIEEYLNKITRYLARAKEWSKSSPFKEPNHYYDVEREYELEQKTTSQ